MKNNTIFVQIAELVRSWGTYPQISRSEIRKINRKKVMTERGGHQSAFIANNTGCCCCWYVCLPVPTHWLNNKI